MDDELCKEVVKGYHQVAIQQWQEKQETQAKLDASFRKILDTQEEYGANLVDNFDFIEWTYADWIYTWAYRSNPEEAEEPELDYRMKQKFVSSPNGRGAEPLRTPEDVEDAVSAIYWFRNRYGLEDNYYNRDATYFDWNEYQSCSSNTRNLVSIYSSYLSQNQYDYRPYQYYPLLDRIVEWMDWYYGVHNGNPPKPENDTDPNDPDETKF